jgi:hypothetical protein
MITYFLRRKTMNIDCNKPEPKKQRLSLSLPLQTSYPDPCSVCSLHQCQMDLTHSIVYTVDRSVTKTMNAIFEKARPGLEQAVQINFKMPDLPD